jgi:hypothetical protein
MRGAINGLTRVEWAAHPSDALTALRLARTLEPSARADRVHQIAARLGLHGLPRFFDRTIVPVA